MVSEKHAAEDALKGGQAANSPLPLPLALTDLEEGAGEKSSSGSPSSLESFATYCVVEVMIRGANVSQTACSSTLLRVEAGHAEERISEVETRQWETAGVPVPALRVSATTLKIFWFRAAPCHSLISLELDPGKRG